jgi:6-phosphogluconolactonase
MSNYCMIRQALLDYIRITPSNIHPIRTDFKDPDQAAKAYEALLRTYFPDEWPSFSLLLLGLGIDGHTASLFPGSAALEEGKRWVMPTRSPAEPHLRITLTLPALTHAKQIYFLVAGADKADAVRRTLTEGDTPAARLLSQRPDSVLWADEAAARDVKHDPIL